MEQSIKINLDDFTCSVTVTDFPLERIKSLSAMPEAIAGHLANVAMTIGLPESLKEELITTALAGTLTYQGICQAIEKARQSQISQ